MYTVHYILNEARINIMLTRETLIYAIYNDILLV